MQDHLQGKSLRKKAGKMILKRPKASPKIPPADTGKLVRELQLHQVELETQNRQLREAQEEIERSRSKYADIYDFAPVGYFTLDKWGAVMEANLTGAGLLGVDRGRLPKKAFSRFIMPEDRDLFRDCCRKVRQTPGRQSCELRLKRKEDDPLWARLEGAAVEGPDGKLTGVRLALMDITDRKKAEEEIRRSEREFRAIFELSRVGMTERDAATGHRIQVNQRLCEMTGYSAEDLLKVKGVTLTHPDDRQRNREVRAAVLKGESEAWVIEKRYVRKNGEVIWVLVNGNLIRDSRGLPYRTVAVIHDITARKRAEEELRKAKDGLETRVAERTEELARSQARLQNLSSQLMLAQEKERKRVAVELHDGLLSELAATKYLLEGKLKLLEKGKPLEPGEFKRAVDILVIVMKEARRIINNLHPSILDELGLIAAVNWLAGEYQKAYPQIKVQKRFEVDEGDIAASLKVVIYRVLQEALNNFARHGKGDGVDLSLAKSGHGLALMIRDNGQGFDAEKVQKGLGLESMRERVELSGGRFQIESTIGRGTAIRAIWSLE